MHTIILLVVPYLICIVGSSAKVTDKEYASMPDLFYMDNWDKCMLLEEQAFYCSFTYTLEPLDPKNVTSVYEIIQEVSSSHLHYNHNILRHFICVPWQCPEIPIGNEDDPALIKALNDCYDAKFQERGFKGQLGDLQCDTPNTQRYPIGIYEITVAVVFLSYIAFVIIATITEGVFRYKTQQEYDQFVSTSGGKIIATFSLTRNWIRLKTVNTTSDVERLRCIQGIRVYNLVLVVFSHTVLTFFGVPLINTKYLETSSEKVLNIFLSSGPLCVSTFFLMSGFLLALGVFDFFDGKKEVTPGFMLFAFINRCFRLTPTLGIILIFHTSWLPHIAHGPLRDKLLGQEYRICRKNWWTNLLYLQNYINREEMCMMQTWYLSLDTQFFLLGLLLAYLMKKNEKNIPKIAGTCLGLHFIVTFVMNYISDYDATILPQPEVFYLISFSKLDQWHSQLTAFYGNIPGLVIGMLYGYGYYKYRNTQILTKKIHMVFWWIIVLLFPLGIIIFPGLIVYNPEVQKNIFWASFYVATCRTVFTIGIGLVIFGCTQGQGWMAKWAVEWKPTYVLGRIVYSSYLIHVTLLKIRPSLLRSPIYADDFTILSSVLSDFFLSFIAGTLLTLFVELPMTEIQKLVLPQKKNKNPPVRADKEDVKKEK